MGEKTRCSCRGMIMSLLLLMVTGIDAAEISLALHWKQLADDLGLSGTVESVAFSPDGSLVGSGCRNGSRLGPGGSRVSMWRVSDGARLWKGDHDYQVKYVAFSPDGKLFSSTGDDKRTKIWDPLSGKLLNTLDIGGTSDAVVFSRGGSHLASASGGTVRIYRTSDWQLERTLSHGGEVNAIHYSPADTLVVTCASDKNVKLWRCSDGKLLRTMKHSYSVKSVRFSPDGSVVASGDGNGITRAWHAGNGNMIVELNPFPAMQYQAKSASALNWPNYIETVTFSPEGTYLATGAHDRRIRLYRTSDWKMALEYNTQPGLPEKDWGTTEGRLNVEDLDFTRDRRYLAAACEDGMVRVYRVSGGTTATSATLESGPAVLQRTAANAYLSVNRAIFSRRFGLNGSRLAVRHNQAAAGIVIGNGFDVE